MLGKVDVIVIDQRAGIEKIRVGSDNGVWDVMFYHIPYKNVLQLTRCRSMIRRVIDIGEYDTVFATPRLPIIIAKSLFRSVVLRLWSIRAAKLRDNLRFGAYGDIALFVPSIIANMFYIAKSVYSMATDHATYSFALRIYPMFKDRLMKLYPPYGFIIKNKDMEQKEPKINSEVLEVIDRGGYVLGFTVLSKKGAYLKFEAKPHAIVLYQIAKKANIDVIIAGSSPDDWRRAFPNIRVPPNLYLIKGFSDSMLPKLYSNAKLIVIPITNRSISNRLLEALFYSKPIIASEIAVQLHPELKHGIHIYISNWDEIVEDNLKLLRDDEMLKRLEEGAKDAYNKYFSTGINAKIIERIVQWRL
jgi:glycosyltransferase involved in cell wall biosynthesis